MTQREYRQRITELRATLDKVRAERDHARADLKRLRLRGAAPQDQRHSLAVGDAAPVVIAPREGADDAHVVSSELRVQDFTGRAGQGDDLDTSHAKPK